MHSYSYAQNTAERFINLIKPFCKRAEIAGSLRRGKSEIGDVDIVIERDKWLLDSYLLKACEKDGIYKHPGYKNGPKYKQVRFEGIKFELYFATKENWGLIFLIRTGPADFSKNMLSKWKTVSNGGESRNGMLYTGDNKAVSVYQEVDFFKLINQVYIEPENRTYL